MGNRAVIVSPDAETGIYVHWNGGLESIIGFCEACRELGYRDPEADPSYGLARLAYAIGLFFGSDELSVGIGQQKELDCDNFDNGTYTIGAGWKIVSRHGAGSRPRDLTRDALTLKCAEKADEIRDTIVRRAKLVAAD